MYTGIQLCSATAKTYEIVVAILDMLVTMTTKCKMKWLSFYSLIIILSEYIYNIPIHKMHFLLLKSWLEVKQLIFLHIHWECSIQWSQQIRAVALKWLCYLCCLVERKLKNKVTCTQFDNVELSFSLKVFLYICCRKSSTNLTRTMCSTTLTSPYTTTAKTPMPSGARICQMAPVDSSQRNWSLGGESTIVMGNCGCQKQGPVPLQPFVQAIYLYWLKRFHSRAQHSPLTTPFYWTLVKTCTSSSFHLHSAFPSLLPLPGTRCFLAFSFCPEGSLEWSSLLVVSGQHTPRMVITASCFWPTRP